MFRTGIAAWTLLSAGAATAQTAQTLTIARGETVTATVAEDGTIAVTARAPAVPTNYEIVASAAFQRGDYAAAIGARSIPMTRDGAGALAPSPEPGRIVLRFVRTPNKDQAMLSIQNGYDRGFVYRATMTVRGRSVPTDVCLVMPGKLGNEYWPDPIDTLTLSDVKLVPWRPGDPVSCR